MKTDHFDFPHRLLTHEEEKELAARIQRVDIESIPANAKSADLTELQRDALAARNTLVECNMRLVVMIAKRFLRYGVPIEDLVQAGAMGLMVAAEKYDPIEFDVRFNTYAGHWIYQRVQYEAWGNLISLPRKLKAEMNKRESDPTYVPDYSKNPELLEKANRAIAFQEFGDRGASSLDRIAIYRDNDNLEDRELVEMCLKRLAPRLLDIVKRRFGIGTSPETLEQIADRHGVTRSRIQQLEFDALNRLRKRLKPKATA